MKKLIKFNLLFTAIAVLVVCSAAGKFYPDPKTCKNYIVKMEIGGGGVASTSVACPNNLCYIPEKECCDVPALCLRCL